MTEECVNGLPVLKRRDITCASTNVVVGKTVISLLGKDIVDLAKYDPISLGVLHINRLQNA